ncbi:hypothetical protein ACFV14_03065 [Streptomyces zaomyceticus]|uniref:hypothetical protein n=1 Tax=Streptomyces zaomyceticus TaxID=68286 RepID=UPI00367F003C
MVIMRPAIPSETVKLDPIDVRRPIGRISVVTMEKIPSMTEMTASQEMVGERSGDAGDGTEGVVSVAMTAIPAGPRAAFWQVPDVNNRPHETVSSRPDQVVAGRPA